MSKKEDKISMYFREMNMTLNRAVFSDFSCAEKERLERLCERMQYLHNQLVSRRDIPQNKFLFMKDEFRALEWVMWEFGLIEGNSRKPSSTNNGVSIGARRGAHRITPGRIDSTWLSKKSSC